MTVYIVWKQEEQKRVPANGGGGALHLLLKWQLSQLQGSGTKKASPTQCSPVMSPAYAGLQKELAILLNGVLAGEAVAREESHCAVR